jgi:ATP synthase F1 epsilon subunit
VIRLQLITLTGVVVDSDVFEVFVPTTAGPIAVNQDHAPLIGAIAPGVLAIRHDKTEADAEREQFGVYGGTIEVLNNTIKVLVDELDSPHDVTESAVEAAYQRALEQKASAKDAVSLEKAQALVDRQAVRLKLASVKKSSKRRY